jgi:hypothetical protein
LVAGLHVLGMRAAARGRRRRPMPRSGGLPADPAVPARGEVGAEHSGDAVLGMAGDPGVLAGHASGAAA